MTPTQRERIGFVIETIPECGGCEDCLNLLRSVLNEEEKPKRKYLRWAYAGGPNECKHGYAKSIPCPTCDGVIDTCEFYGDDRP